MMDELKAEIGRIDKDIKLLNKTVGEIHAAIVGNPLSKDGGIVERISDVEKKQVALQEDVDKYEKDQIKYQLQTKIMWLSLGGCVSMVFSYLATIIFKH